MSFSDLAIKEIGRLELIFILIGAVGLLLVGLKASAAFLLGGLLIYLHYLVLVSSVTKLIQKRKKHIIWLYLLSFLISLLIIGIFSILLAKKDKNMLIYYFLGLMTLGLSANVVGVKLLLRKKKNGRKTVDS